MAQTLFSNCPILLTAGVVAAVNATTDTAGDKKTIDVEHISQAALYLYAEGAHGSCALNLTFYFQVSPDGSNWFDLPAVIVPLNGSAQVKHENAVVPLDLTGVHYLRLDRVANAETTGGYTATVNAALYRKGF